MSMKYTRPSPLYAPMPKEKRQGLVKRQGFCSTSPAERINDTVFCANGSLKALVYGDPVRERIDFFHELFYMPKWKNPPAPPMIADILPDIRQMLLEGRLKEAPARAMQGILRDSRYDELMRWSPDHSTRWSIHSSRRHPAFSLNILTDTKGHVRDYLRTMDYTSGEAKVYFTDDCRNYVRALVVSRPDSAAILRLQAPDRGLNVTIELDRLGGQPDVKWDGGAHVEMTLDGHGKEFVFRVTGQYPPRFRDMGFGAAVRVYLKDGKGVVRNGHVEIEDADEILISVMADRCAPYDGTLPDELSRRLADLGTDYDRLLCRHAAVQGELMSRSELELGEAYLDSVEELLEAQVDDPGSLPTALYEKMYAAGRSFLVSDTGMLPPAYGQYNINVNLQVCSGNLTSLPEMMEVFFRFFESKMGDFRQNAKNIFGCRGILASIHPDEESGLMYHFSGPWPHFYWISCAGWVYNEFWGHYLTTGDKDFLRQRVVPGLKEIALFYEDYLKDKDENGNYIFYPCFSPENGQARGYPITINALMDIFVCREVLQNLLTACRVLGLNEDKEPIWQDMLAHMPDLLLDQQGALREWAWDSIPDDLDHRHVSHHYAAWPGFEINPDDEPELSKAVLRSNHKRGQENDSAHGLMHRLFSAIRLGDPKGVEIYLHQFAEHGFINTGLMTNHNPHRTYFPDALGGLPAALAEMCVTSRLGHVTFLPAMSDDFPEGHITGLSLYTFAKMNDMRWDLKKGELTAQIESLQPQTVELSCGRGMKEVLVDAQPVCAGKICSVTFDEKQKRTITLRF